ncbi:hypothetical protein K523DRAFT_104634 [Schizophyllum commune Tattone D]|nr:hypothetical protein K523DRAFT_104634 [Schizophyllum commune Tattone D]
MNLPPWPSANHRRPRTPKRHCLRRLRISTHTLTVPPKNVPPTSLRDKRRDSFGPARSLNGYRCATRAAALEA